MCEGFDKILQWDAAEKAPKLHLKATTGGEDDGYDDETVLHAQKGVRFYTDKGELGRGVLQVTSMRLLWFQPDADPLSGYETSWTHVTLHAVSRDPESGYPPCIYCQISSSDNSDDDEMICECRFVPDDLSSLESIFNAMSKASEMNPDEDMESDDDDAFVASGDFDFPITYNCEGGDDDDDDNDKIKPSNGGFKRKL